MASKKKLLQAAAGSAGGAGLDIDEAFSTYLYDGTGSAQTITNGIDLSSEGGLVWIKRRNSVRDYLLFDTERGTTKWVESNTQDAEATDSTTLTSFNSNGFSLGSYASVNGTGVTPDNYVSWTFRKAPKFFDVVTYSGNGATRTISHNLGSDVGMLIVKRTDASAPWAVWHRQLNGGTNSGQYYLQLNSTNAEAASSPYWNNTAPTSTEFTVSSDGHVNNASGTYVAYLFAHNDGDGTFGPDGDQDIIKCGSFTEVSGSDVKVTLGFEPQWIMIKVTSTTGGWGMYDVMRGWTSGSDDFALSANTSNAESNVGDRWLIHPDGFTWKNTGNTRDIIYMAVRRGPLAEPTSATDVFAIDVRDDTNAPMYKSGFVTDFALYRDKAGADDWKATSRLLGATSLFTNTTDAENTAYTDHTWDWMNGFHEAGSINTGYLSWMWKRAPGYFDVVTYSGTGSARTVNHNLGAVPEMMWVKRRDTTASWVVYHKGLNGGTTPEDYVIELNNTNAEYNNANWNDTAPTSSVFSVGTANSVNNSSGTYIAYLFASLAGVSKVGSFTSDGTDMTIDCGFSSGAKFVVLKKTNATDPWWVWDTTRGIVAGNDPRLKLDSTSNQATGADNIDPDSSGFIINNNILGGSGNSFIFYAIA